MIAKTALTLLLLATALAALPTVAATEATVGDCSRLTCASACVGSDDCPGYDNLACMGFSHQMPACVHDPTTYTIDSAASADAARCMGPVCDAVNAVCWIALKAWCVG